jgi:hypothetical protein
MVDDRGSHPLTKRLITMSTWRKVFFLALLLGTSGLAMVLPGCGPGGGASSGPSPTPEVKVAAPVGGSGSVSDEHKNLSPAGKGQ